MLVLNRRRDQRIIIDGRIEVQVLDIRAGVVRLGFTAPDDVAIHRQEVYERIRQAEREERGESIVVAGSLSLQ